MLISSISSSPVQISTAPASGGIAPYCCSEPSCPCEGGRAAKAALETKQLQENNDRVSISAQAQEKLRSESNSEVSAPISAQAPPPVFNTEAAAFADSAYESPTPLLAPISAYINAPKPLEDSGNIINTYV